VAGSGRAADDGIPCCARRPGLRSVGDRRGSARPRFRRWCGCGEQPKPSRWLVGARFVRELQADPVRRSVRRSPKRPRALRELRDRVPGDGVRPESVRQCLHGAAHELQRRMHRRHRECRALRRVRHRVYDVARVQREPLRLSRGNLGVRPRELRRQGQGPPQLRRVRSCLPRGSGLQQRRVRDDVLRRPHRMQRLLRRSSVEQGSLRVLHPGVRERPHVRRWRLSM
jgi:hypothetical protein